MPDSTRPPPARSVRDLPPNIFAIVMATGIVAIALNATGWLTGGYILFWIGLLAYAVIWVLTAARCVRHWSAVQTDLTTHARAPGFFTVVAATGVLGNGSVLLHDAPRVGLALWIATLVLWAGLSYTILPGLMEVEDKPDLDKGLSGTWLLVVVGTQSVCVLGSLVVPHLPEGETEAGWFAALCFWLVGGMLYLWLIALILYRILFRPLTPADLAPPYWINMGAMAISTLAGVSLVSAARSVGLLTELLPFLKGLTLMFWATATWWLPLLVMLGVWRHGVKGYPLSYDHGYWGAVFPLGMYSVCTIRLAREFGLPFLTPLGEVFAWVALAAWAATAAGLARRLLTPSRT
ncbi:MAG TPA: tellurite resistance/C4-dicarboxylate transporter family protein [Fimbriiglobus sp.]|nr:tellurite resistance/C4-dicarboxylate transporter family protein [Fimbriiglobus sp.]